MIYIAHSENELRKSFELRDGQVIERKDLFNPGTKFSFEQEDARSLDDVADLLRRLADDPHRAIVMGRALHQSGERNATTFADDPTSFWFIDLDGVPTGDDHRATIERCLPFLRGHRYVFAYSQSAGIKSGLRCRVVCRLPRPLRSSELVAYARYYNDQLVAFDGKTAQYIDSSIYTPSDLLFTSRPRLLGLGDPHLERVFIVEGEDAPVTLDALPELVEISVGAGRTKFGELPRLVGFGKDGGDQDHSIHALNAIGWLRAFMGEDDWADEQKRLALWHEMLRNADATPYELRQYGDFVIRRAKDARPPPEVRTVLAIPNPDRSIPLDRAQTQLKQIIASAMQSEEPRCIFVSVTMGVGKTFEAIRQAETEHYRRTDHNPLVHHNFDYYVPTRQMGEEALETARKLGFEAFFEYGRGQEIDGEPICIKADSAGKLQGFGLNVAESLCRNADGAMCEHYAQCRWQWQRDETHAIPLRIRAHNYLSLMVRAEGHHAYRPTDFVIIDEASFVSRLTHEQTIEIGELIAPRVNDEAYPWVLAFAAVLKQGLSLERLAAAGFTPDVCRMLIKAEEELAPKVTVTPDMTPEATSKALGDFEEGWFRYASVWRRLRDCIEKGSLNRIHVICEQDRPVRLSLAWRSPLKGIPWDKERDRPAVNVLVLSGTMRRSIIEQFLPVDEWHEIEAAPHPGAVIIQSDLRGSKSECLYGSTPERRAPPEKGGNGENDADKIKAAEQTRALVRQAAEGKVLITYKELEEQIGADAHFGAVEGLNAFSGRDLVIYGRPLPHPRQMETEARAIFCDDPEPIREIRGAWYQKRAVARRGEGFGYADYHPDPRVEDVRWMTCEGEIMQAVHRARLVRHPAKVTILNGTPLPLRIDDVRSHHRLDPQWAELESARAVPLSQNEYPRLYPRIAKDWRSMKPIVAELAQKLHQERFGIEVEYRLPGQRGPSKRAVVDGIEAIRALGGVSHWAITDHEKNEWALAAREMRDFMAREPMDADDLDDDCEVSLVGVGRGVALGKLRGAGGVHRNLWGAST